VRRKVGGARVEGSSEILKNLRGQGFKGSRGRVK